MGLDGQYQVLPIRVHDPPGDNKRRTPGIMGEHTHRTPLVAGNKYVAQQHRLVACLGLADLGENALAGMGGWILRDAGVESHNANVQPQGLLAPGVRQPDLSHRCRPARIGLRTPLAGDISTRAGACTE